MDNKSTMAARTDKREGTPNGVGTASQGLAGKSATRRPNRGPIGRVVYSTCYSVSYGVVYPVLFISSFLPRQNAVANGLVDGAQAAQAKMAGIEQRRAIRREERRAEQLAAGIFDPILKANAIFDVMLTGEPTFANTYLHTQQIQTNTTAIRIVVNKDTSKRGDSVTLTAFVTRKFAPAQTALKGSVTFSEEGKTLGEVKLDANGRATLTTNTLDVGKHEITAKFTPEAKPTFTAKDQSYLELTREDDYYAVTRRLGLPSADRWKPGEGELKYRALVYKDRGYAIILMGTEQEGAHYIGTMGMGGDGKEWKMLHYVEYARGASTASMLRSLPRF